MAVDRQVEPAPESGSMKAGRRPRPAIEELETAVGHVFANRDLLARALTHVSATPTGQRGQTYQRLEFLGDRVLGLAVADMLCRLFPEADEGELSRRLADLVRKETCADVARDWDAGSHLRLGGSEARSGGRDKTALLGDVCEAIIAAVYLDGGYPAACGVVERSFAGRMAAPRNLRDSKTSLQEWAQARGLPPPAYRLIARSGPDHAPIFTIGVDVEGFSACEAEGPSKRAAEQTAAGAFMRREGLLDSDSAEPVSVQA
jgi:ribonuclease-3